ncbi:outer membrane beta-barrel protein [Bradyrhizobium sp.]|uniref:outer membrane protein n=1 Tax=Bradyrhizobium sp. TaxID=376 RepID=UPI002390A97D|nr:outer membrane beta-barrel protein [Bradyrhizobium sp.]MDE2379992.1 porin family protein [Bradyrhizobium sp.]
MKALLLATTSLAALSAVAPAVAADLAARPYTKAPPAVYDWSGFYVGINGGGGSSHKCWDVVALGAGPVVPAVPEGCHDATGGTVGGQVGYRWQSASWVFGLEGQGNWADFSGDNATTAFPAFWNGPQRNRSRIDAFGLVTGQVGYAWNSVLLYVKGGGAVVGDKYEVIDTPTGLVAADGRETRWGGTVGVGLEFAFAPNWSVGVEYDHLFLGHHDVDFYATGGLRLFDHRERIGQDVDIGLVRVNYRFGGPLIAKY